VTAPLAPHTKAAKEQQTTRNAVLYKTSVANHCIVIFLNQERTPVGMAIKHPAKNHDLGKSSKDISDLLSGLTIVHEIQDNPARAAFLLDAIAQLDGYTVRGIPLEKCNFGVLYAHVAHAYAVMADNEPRDTDAKKIYDSLKNTYLGKARSNGFEFNL